MKNVPIVAAAALFAMTAACSAQVAYTNSVLRGCYGYLASSVDTQPGALNRQNLGTMCFDGTGKILGTPLVPARSGHYTNTNGVVSVHPNINGTYQVTNWPGDGMGTMRSAESCGTHAFSINSVDAHGLARGFQFMIIKRKNCKHHPNVIGGTAYYQGPYQTAP